MRGRNNFKKSSSVLTLSSGIDYALLDIGNGRKLERFGALILDRPEIEAKSPPKLSRKEWEKADWHFYEQRGKQGKWTNNTGAPSEWTINYQFNQLSLDFSLKLTAFKHVGIFPEQAENWKFVQQQLSHLKGEKKVLNLFAYTGAASIVSAACGATVTNVDSVKQVLNWGRENAALNSVSTIRWILEDARKFVQKSLKRGDLYNGIIMDPPAFGYGSKNEKWKLERDIQELLTLSMQLMLPKQSFFVLNTYSPKLPLQKLNAILKNTKRFPANYEGKTLGLKTKQKQTLPLGNLIRFVK